MRFSVIMPAFNAEKTIGKAIDSVLAQSAGDWELIVIDDGSADATAAVVAAYTERCDAVRYYRQENAGPGAARNTGMAHSRGEYICFLDSDDYWEPDFLSLIGAKIDEKAYDLIFYGLIRENGEGKKISTSDLSRLTGLDRQALIGHQISGDLEWGMVKVVRASLIKEHDLAFSADFVAEELVFSVDLLLYAGEIAWIETPVYHYVDSQTGQHKKGQVDPWGNAVGALHAHLRELGRDALYGGSLRALGVKALAIAAYRLCLCNKYRQAKALMREKKRFYAEQYDVFGYEPQFVDRKTRLVARLLKAGLYLPIYVLSKLRGRGRA